MGNLTTGLIKFMQNKNTVTGGADPGGKAPDQTAYWFQKGRHAVDGKHPEGGFSHQLQLSFSVGAEGGKKDFQTPSGKTAK